MGYAEMRLEPINNQRSPHPFRLTQLAVLLLPLAGVAWADEIPPVPAPSSDVEFNDAFFGAGATTNKVDFTRFNKGNVALPGTYMAGLVVNQASLGKTRVRMQEVGGDSRNVQACFDRNSLLLSGVDMLKLSPQALEKLADAGACTVLPDLVPGAIAVFDPGEMTLNVSVPQAFINQKIRGYVDPQLWDEGIPAATLQYNANTYRNKNTNGQTDTQSYLGLTAGLNAGPWRLRYVGNLTRSDASGTRYQQIQTYVQRGLPSIKSQVTLGDTFTDGAMLDSYGIRGVQFASDDRMYPESQRGFAPTIHGIATTNAQVQIRQAGNIIYETTVAPGAFEITDLYATGYGSDLDVIVTEADGSQHISRVPYATTPNALRPGMTRYSVAAGQYREENGDTYRPYLAQATVQHGLTNLLTVYGGGLAGQNYVSAVGGVALNTSVGAFGIDLTAARATLPDETRSGRSLRATYSRMFAPTNTNVALAAYRFSTSGFVNLQDAVGLYELQQRYPGGVDYNNGVERGRFQAIVNQALAEGWGSFYFSGSLQNYWNQKGTDTQYSAGYSNQYKTMAYGVSANRQFDTAALRWQNRLMINMSVPLGGGAHAPVSNTMLTHDSSGGRNSLQENLSGTLGVDNALSYGLNASRDSGAGMSDSSSLAANAGYISPYANLGLSASKSNGYTQSGVSVAGGVVAYSGGVVFAPSLSDTIGIVEADDAYGARLTNGTGLRVDPWGHAVVSSLTPYMQNDIEIDPKGLPMSVNLKTTSQQAVPTAGAVVWLKFETENAGRAAVIRATLPNGEPLPFGAEVFDELGDTVGTVAQAGRIMAQALKADTGVLTVKWGNAPAESCMLNYALPALQQNRLMTFYNAPAACK